MAKRIPDSVVKALKDRYRHAAGLLDADSIVSAFCIHNNIDTEYTHLHAALVGEPDMAYRATMDAILSAGYE